MNSIEEEEEAVAKVDMLDRRVDSDSFYPRNRFQFFQDINVYKKLKFDSTILVCAPFRSNRTYKDMDLSHLSPQYDTEFPLLIRLPKKEIDLSNLSPYYDKWFPPLLSKPIITTTTMTDISVFRLLTNAKKITLYVKTLSGDIYSLPTNENATITQLTTTFYELYSDIIAFRPMLMRMEDEKEEHLSMYRPFEDKEVLCMVPFPVDYGASIEYVTSNINIYGCRHKSIQFEEFYMTACYEAIVYQGTTRVYFPFLVIRTNPSTETLFAIFHYNCSSANQKACNHFVRMIERREKEATYYRENGSGWNYEVKRWKGYNVMHPDEYYPEEEPITFNSPHLEFYTIQQLLKMFEYHFLPNQLDMDDYLYWNQFLIHAFTEKLKEEFPECF